MPFKSNGVPQNILAKSFQRIIRFYLSNNMKIFSANHANKGAMCKGNSIETHRLFSGHVITYKSFLLSRDISAWTLNYLPLILYVDRSELCWSVPQHRCSYIVILWLSFKLNVNRIFLKFLSWVLIFVHVLCLLFVFKEGFICLVIEFRTAFYKRTLDSHKYIQSARIILTIKIYKTMFYNFFDFCY